MKKLGFPIFIFVLLSDLLYGITIVPASVLKEREKLPAEFRCSKRAPFYPAISVNRLAGSNIFREKQAYRSYTPELIWPHICVDRLDRIHMITTTNTDTLGGTPAGTPQPIAYFRSDDLGRSWFGPVFIDTLYTISAIVVSSRISNKVAIVYTHPISSDVYNGDIYYLESPDGVSWDLSRIVNATHFTSADTIRAYCDLDAIYDESDELHIVFNAPYYVGGSVSSSGALLMHWTGTRGLTVIASGWYDTSPGAWNRTISKPNIGINPSNGYLYVTWTQFFPGDISSGGYSNGDICAAVSTDNGLTWSPPHNLTRTRSPGALAGSCNSDHWSSLAEIVNDTLHIIYINDKDAGGIPQSEGTWTYNPVKYLAVPASILLEPPITTPNTESPGITVGHTWYDYQHNGSMGKMIALDRFGGVHLIYMKGFDAGATVRHMMYNYKPAGGSFLWDEGVRVEGMTRSGYGTIDVLSDGRAVPGYHTDMIPEDRTGPIATIEMPLNNTFSACANQAIVIRVEDERGVNPEGFRLGINGVPYSWGSRYLSYIEPTLMFSPPVAFADGETVEVVLLDAVDSLGNHLASPLSWRFFIDLSPPSASLIFPPPGSVISCTDTTVRIFLYDRGSGVNRDSVRIELNGVPVSFASLRWVGDTVVITPPVALSEGTHIVTLTYAADRPDYCPPNISPQMNWQFTVDLTGVTCEILSPLPGSIVDTIEPNVDMRLVDNFTPVQESGIEVDINGHRIRSGSSGFDFSSGYLRINTHNAGLSFVAGESVRVRLISAYDTPDYCAPNPVASPCEFFFIISSALARLTEAVGSPGETVLVPVSLENISGTNLTSIQITVSSDPSITSPVGIGLRGGLLDSWSLTDLRVGDGSLNATISGPPIVARDTVFFFVEFFVNPEAPTGSYTALHINSAVINGRSPANTEDGILLVSWRELIWLVDLFYGNESQIFGNVSIGLSPSGSSGFDPGIDRIYLPTLPGTVSCAIEIEDALYPYIRLLSRQVENSRHLPARFVIRTYGNGVLRWHPSAFPQGRFILNGYIDMHIDSVYHFNDGEQIIIEYSQPMLDLFTLTLRRGWNLISLPVIPIDFSFSRVFPTAIGSLYKYDAENRRYISTETPAPGDGFFLLSRTDTTYTIAGISINSIRKPLFSGWNLFGSINAPSPLPVENLRTEPADAIVPGTFFRLTPAGTYEHATNLAPGHGYWILSRTSGFLIIERSR